VSHETTIIITMILVKTIMFYCYGFEGITSQFDTKWVGWPGVDVHDEIEKNALTESLAEMVRI